MHAFLVGRFTIVQMGVLLWVPVPASLTAKPEFIDDVSAAVHEITEPTSLEIGCLRYDLHRRAKASALVCVLERWTSAEALRSYITLVNTLPVLPNN